MWIYALCKQTSKQQLRECSHTEHSDPLTFHNRLRAMTLDRMRCHCSPLASARSRGHGVHKAGATTVAACTHVRTRLAPESHRTHETPQVLRCKCTSASFAHGMIALNPLSFRIFTVYLNRALCIFAVCAAACTRPRRHGTDIAQLTLVRNTCRDAKCHATIPIQCDSMRRRQKRLVASGRFSQQMIGRSENRARSSQGSPTTNFVREWLLLGPESRNPQHVDAELPQMLL